MKTKIVDELVKLGEYKIKDDISLSFSSSKLSQSLSDFLSDLISVEGYYGGLSKVFIACDSITPGTEKPFGVGKRDIIPIGRVLYLMCEYGFDEFRSTIDEYTGEISLNGEIGLPSELLPIVLTDSYGDNHHLICIDKFGRVVEFIPELDTSDVSILANDQDEFVDKLRIIKQD